MDFCNFPLEKKQSAIGTNGTNGNESTPVLI
jgi:hypothetical protein